MRKTRAKRKRLATHKAEQQVSLNHRRVFLGSRHILEAFLTRLQEKATHVTHELKQPYVPCLLKKP